MTKTMQAAALLERLHACPEQSGHEQETADTVAAFLEAAGLAPERGIGGHGILVRLGEPPYRLLRADLDAIPDGDGARHGCGHDGHMTMLAMALVQMHKDGIGGVAGLFQPSEEDGSGMARCLQDPRLADLPVRDAFAIHNIPGLPLGTLEIGPGALASVGVRIHVHGREAHAATPDMGDNPYHHLRKLADEVAELATGLGPHALATLIHVRLGQEAYGTSPGEGIIATTLRGSDDDVAAMRKRWLALCPEDVDVAEVDPFPATNNTDHGRALAEQAAKAAGIRVQALDTPYPWSEDVGWAVGKWGGALVGLGSGTDQPPLHDEAYQFPKQLLEHGIRFWCALGALP